MAEERSSVVEIIREHGTSPETERPTSSDGLTKKKKFAPLKSLKKLFSSNKKKKSKEDVCLKSTSCEVLDTSQNEGVRQLSNKNLMSVSADSVFSSDRTHDASLEFSRSIDAMPGGNFKDELARKLHGRSSDDEGFPSSPGPHTTIASIENGLKGDSEHSLMSVDSGDAELEEDFFQKDWVSGGSYLSESSYASDLDLDAVASSTSLNISAAKHKIAIKPKTKARTSAYAQHRRAVSPKPDSGVMVLPMVNEDTTEMEPSGAKMDLGEEDVNSPPEKIESTDDETETHVKGLDLTSDRETEQDLNQSDDIERDPEIQEVSIDFSDKTCPSSDDDDLKHSPRDNDGKSEGEIPAAVVLREKNIDSTQSRDSVNRRTIHGDGTTEVTPFGERKVKRSSLIIENRDWAQVGRVKDTLEEEPENEQKGSEFASVFAKFRNISKQKTSNLDTKLEPADGKRGSVVFKAEKLTRKESDSRVIGVNTPVKGVGATVPTKDKPVKGNVRVKTQENNKSTQVEEKKSVELKKIKPLVKKSNEVEKVNVVKPEKTEEKGKLDSGSNKAPSKILSKEASGEIVSKRTSGESKKPAVEVISKRHSGEVSKSKSGENELKRNSGENSSKSNSGAMKTSQAHTLMPNSENKIGVSSKFISVHARSEKLNVTKKPEVVTKKPEVVTKKPEVVTKKPEIVIKKPEVTATTSHKSDNVGSSSKVAETKVIIVSEGDKDKDSSVANSGNSKATAQPLSSAYKRDSPRATNRLRSHTLPGPSTTKFTQSGGESPSLKHANSHGGVNKENIPAASDETSSKKATVVRSSVSNRPAPQKLGVGGTPSWIDMARKRTDGWNDDKDKDTEGKNESSNSESVEKGSSVLDLMKRFQ